MNVPVVSHLKLLVNLYNKMNNRFLVLLVIYLIIYLLSVLYKNKQIFCAILLSLLSWERGLKYLLFRDYFQCGVAPLVGAWIEISEHTVYPPAGGVAPLVGAWIEILKSTPLPQTVRSLLSWERGVKFAGRTIVMFEDVVAPLVGAWIEILISCVCIGSLWSLLSWERGLKLLFQRWLPLLRLSLLSWERGLKLERRAVVFAMRESLLSWERGLKWISLFSVEKALVSLLSWERGLKFHDRGSGDSEGDVAPLVGAWIEIFFRKKAVSKKKRRSSRGSVD